MVSQKVKIKNPTGLHLHAAGILHREATCFQSTIMFTCGTTSANAKSLLSILGSCIKCGDEIELFCMGADEEEALQKIIALIEGGLEE